MDIPSLSWYLEELDLGEHDIALGPHFLSITQVKNRYLPKSVVPVRCVVTMIFYSVKLVPVCNLREITIGTISKEIYLKVFTSKCGNSAMCRLHDLLV